jgi:hypothetical protein
MVEINHSVDGPDENVPVKKLTLKEIVNASGASEAKSLMHEMEHELKRQDYI